MSLKRLIIVTIFPVVLFINNVYAAEDCGFRFYNGTKVVKGSCEDAGTLTSPLRIRKGATTYGINLVDPCDSSATAFKVNPAGGVKAIKDYDYFTCGVSTIKDADCNKYTTVQIGSQCWMGENMRTTKYPDNSAITDGTSSGTWSSDNSLYSCPPNSINSGPDCTIAGGTEKRGLLYQWSTAMYSSTSLSAQGICPSGWHIPTDDEWHTLELGLATGSCPSSRPSWDWNYCDPAGTKLKSDVTTNFLALLSGVRHTNGAFIYYNTETYLWSSNEYDASIAWMRTLYNGGTTVNKSTASKAGGYSVRCLKDNPGYTIGAITGPTTEAGGTATFTVKLSAQPSGNVVIDVASSDTGEGTISPASLTFTTANWNTNQTVTLTGVNDAIDDGNVGYTAQLTVNTGATTDNAYDAIDPNDVSVTNNDDSDTAGFTISAISGNTTEAGGTATFTAKLTSEPTGNVVINVLSLDTGEGTASPASLTFTTGNWNSNQTVTVTGVDDAVVDGDIAYTVQLTVNAGSTVDTTYDPLSPNDVSVTNTDDDVASFTCGVSTVAAADVGYGSDVNTVQIGTQCWMGKNMNVGTMLASGSTNPVNDATVEKWCYSNNTANCDSDGGFYSWDEAMGWVTTEGSQGICPSGWHIPSDAELYTLENYLATGSCSSTRNGSYDCDPAGTELKTGGSSGFAALLAGYRVTNGAFYSRGNGAYVWSSTEIAGSAWMRYLTTFYSMVSRNPYSKAYGWSVRCLKDPPGYTIGSISAPTTEAGGTATFTIKLSAQPSGNVVLNVASSDTTEGTVFPSTLTFTTVNWDSNQTVTVTGVDDAIADGNIGYTIQLTVDTGATADATYDALDPNDVSVTNNDDSDTAGFTISTISGNTTEAGGTATFTAKLLSEPTGNVVIDVLSLDAGEGTASPASLTFTTANWNSNQTVTVTGVDDVDIDGDIAYTVQLTINTGSTVDTTYDPLNPNDVSVINTDDDTGPSHTYNTGTGVNGACSWVGGTLTAGTYNCTTVSITGVNDVTGSVPLIIKATGAVTVSGTLDLNGNNGSGDGGSKSTNVANNGGGGDGGGSGGSGYSGYAGYNAPSSCRGLWSGNRSGSGAGFGGGGGYGENNSNGNGPSPGSSFGTDFGDDSASEPILYGGCGGGGGANNDGRPGGTGGGVVSIVSAGTITISGTITANGGNGGSSANDYRPGGGGGSGGGIFLAGSDIVNNGNVSAAGGGGGTNNRSSGGFDGGGGGGGRIRMIGVSTVGTVDVSGGSGESKVGSNGVFSQL